MDVKLVDIARKVGVTPSTVSITLRNHPRSRRFSEETRSKIFSVAKELDYKPNFYASQMRRSDKKMLMLCLSYLQDAYSAVIAEKFERRALERGYRTMVSVFQDKEDPFAVDREILHSGGISGMVVVGGETKKLTDQDISVLTEEGGTIVLVGREINHPSVSCVLSDNYRGGQLAADYLYAQGISSLWLIEATEFYARQKNERKRGFQEVVQRLGAPEPVILAGEANRSEFGYNVVKKNLKSRGLPEGIFAVTDRLAYGVMRALYEEGYRVGEDVAVVGYDDIWPSEYTSPALTTVKQPMEEMGLLAADMLIDTLQGTIKPGQKVSLSPELIIRQSGRRTAGTR